MTTREVSILCVASSKRFANNIRTSLSHEYTIEKWKWFRTIPLSSNISYLPDVIVLLHDKKEPWERIQDFGKQWESSIRLLIVQRPSQPLSRTKAFDRVLSVSEVINMQQVIAPLFSLRKKRLRKKIDLKHRSHGYHLYTYSGKKYRFQDGNTKAEKLLGLSTKESIGRSLHEVLEPHVPKSIVQTIVRFSQGTGTTELVGGTFEINGKTITIGAQKIDHFHLLLWFTEDVSVPVKTKTIVTPDSKTYFRQLPGEETVEVLKERVQHYEELFSKTFLTTPDAVNINRLSDGLYIAINEGFTALTGYTWNDVNGKTSLELNIWVNPDDRKRIVEQLLTERKVKEYEARFRMKDGSIRYGIMSASVVTINGEQCILSITRDVTDRKLIENRYRSLFESSPDPIVVFDEDFIICDINQRAFDAWGNERKDYFIGKSVLDFLAPEDRERALLNNNALRQTTVPHTTTYTLVRSDQVRVTCEVSISHYPQEPGKKRQFIAILRDITSNLRIQKEVQMLAHALKSIQESVVIVDTTGMILYVNEQFEQTYGYHASEIQSQHYNTFIYPGIVDEVEVAFEQCRKDGEWRGEQIHRKKDGTLFHVQSALYCVYNDTQNISAFVNIIQDLTKERKTEEILRKIVRGTSTTVGVEFFKSFAYHLASTLMVNTVIVGSIETQNACEVRQIAYWNGQQESQVLSIPIDCDDVGTLMQAKQEFLTAHEIPSSIGQVLFPDRNLSICGIILLRSAEKKVIGLIVLADSQRREFSRQEIAVLKIFAARAAAELQRLRAEDEWKKLLLAVEYNPVAIAIVTREHRIEYVNPQFTAMTGYSLNELKNQRIYEIPFEQASHIRALLVTKEGEQGEDIVVTKHERREVTTYVRSIPIYDATKAVSHYVILIEDISYRKRIEDRLRYSEERLREIFENDITGNYVCLIDGRIVDCNLAFMTMFGFPSHEEACRYSVHELYTNPSTFYTIVRKLQAKEKIIQQEYEMRRRDGKVVYVIQNILGIYNDDGTLKEMLGYIFDMTEQHRLELQARQSQKMELIGTLAGGIAHDFNNILNNIIGFSTQVRKHVHEPERIIKYCNSIEKSASRGAQIASQLLQFSRLKDAEVESVDIESILQEIASLVRETFPKTIILQEEIKESLHTVRGDRGALYEVFLNLCINARDAMPDGGTLTIRAYNGIVGVDTNPEWFTIDVNECVCIEVSDTGVGISENDLPKIFEPFYTTKEKGRGTGLGLSIAYNAVKNSGGSIIVESTLHKGTTFKVYLPAMNETPSEQPEEKNQMTRANGEKILLVDDEEAMLILGKEILEERGFRVLTAKNGAEAVELYAQEWQNIDLVILDLIMPLKDGGQAYLEMKEINPNIKAIFCSGFTSSKIISQLLEHEHLSAIQKPFRDEELIALVFKVLSA